MNSVPAPAGTDRVPPAQLSGAQRLPFLIVGGIIVLGAVFLLVRLLISPLPMPGLVAVAAVGWLVWGAVFGWIVLSVDLYRARFPALVIMAGLWGVFVVYSVSPFLTGGISALAGNPNGLSGLVIAPIMEEGLKFAGVVAVLSVWPAARRRLMAVLLVGLVIGIGYAAAENWGYSAGTIAGASSVENAAASSVPLFVLRGLLAGPWSHPAFTGLVAVGYWYLRNRTDTAGGRRAGVFAGCILAALVLHSATNAGDHLAAIGPVVGIVAQLGSLALLIFLIHRARRSERVVFADTLSHAETTSQPVADPTEIQALTSRTRRRRARRAARKDGRSNTAEKQALQVQFANASNDYPGPATPGAVQLAERISALREQ